MSTEENPYEALPPDSLTQEPGARRRLTIGESIAAFLVTLIVSCVTFFVTCLGVFALGSGIDSPTITGIEGFDTVLLLGLVIGGPILMTAVVGRMTLKSFVRAVTAAPSIHNNSQPDAPETGGQGVGGAKMPGK